MSRHVFAAVPVPARVKQMIHEPIDPLKSNLPFKQWVYEEDYHLTLSFLGQTDDRTLEDLRTSFRSQREQHKPFSLTLTNGGFFGKKTQPRVFWLGVEKEPALFELQHSVAETCREAGFVLDSRPYSPHITLAKRWGDPTVEIHERYDQRMLKRLAGVSFEVQSFVLYETHLDKVPKYRVIESFDLTGGGEG